MAISATSNSSNGTATIQNRKYKHALTVFTALILLKTFLTCLYAFIQHQKFLIEIHHISTISPQFSMILSFIVRRVILLQRFAIMYVGILIGIGISSLLFNFFRNAISIYWESYWKNVTNIYSNNIYSAHLYCQNI